MHEPNYVTCKLSGRTGNQLFQLASTIGLATKFNLNFRFPEEYVNDPNNSITKYSDQIQHFILKQSERNNEVRVVENGFNYREYDLHPGRNYVLDGYWQCDRYWYHCTQTIANFFAPKTSVMSEIPKPTANVAMHVRCGDYMNDPYIKKFHNVGLTENGYYLRAYQQLGCQPTDIYSDDPEWCEKNLRGIGTNVKVIRTHPDPFMTIHQMAQYKNHVISNSSFSWWAAWLSKYLYKTTPVIIMPKQWFGEAYCQQDLGKRNPTCYIGECLKL